MKRSPLHRKTPLARGKAKRWRPDVEGQAFWSAMREARIILDAFRCTSCGDEPRVSADLHVHHRDALGMGASRYDPTNEKNRITNLITLCAACHAKEHSA